MKSTELIPVSDFYKLAVLDLHKITPIKAEHAGRYWAYFSIDEAGTILNDYEAGRLQVVAREFVSSISRVKDRIFELERATQRSAGRYGRLPTR